MYVISQVYFKVGFYPLFPVCLLQVPSAQQKACSHHQGKKLMCAMRIVLVSKRKCWEDSGKEGPTPTKKVQISMESKMKDKESEDKP